MKEWVNHRARLFEAIGELDNPPFKPFGDIEQAYVARVFDVEPTSHRKDRMTLVQVPDMDTEDALPAGLYLVRRVITVAGNTHHGRYYLIVCDLAGNLTPLWTWMRNDEPQTAGRTMLEGQVPTLPNDLHFIAGALAVIKALFHPDENLDKNFTLLDERHGLPVQQGNLQRRYMGMEPRRT